MEKTIDMQVELSEMSLMFNNYILNLEKRLEKNKQRVMITRLDLDILVDVQKKLNNIAKNNIIDMRTTLIEEREQLQQELAYKNGRLSTITNMLELCYNDYKNNNRTDAIQAIESAVNKTGI